MTCCKGRELAGITRYDAVFVFEMIIIITFMILCYSLCFLFINLYNYAYTENIKLNKDKIMRCTNDMLLLKKKEMKLFEMRFNEQKMQTKETSVRGFINLLGRARAALSIMISSSSSDIQLI